MKKLKVRNSQSDVAPLRLDAENEEFWKGEERLRLSRKPFAMLRLMVERSPKWVSKDDFYTAIWKPKDEDVMDWTFTTYVHEIRKMLGDETSPHRYVETGANKGYRFIGPITNSDQLNQNTEANAGHPPARSEQLEFELVPDPRPPIPYVVGREAELARLHKWLDRALAGERQLVFVTGEPGIGKTTLVRTFLREVATSGAAAIVRGQCIEQYGPGEAYLPVLEAIGRWARDPRGSFLVEWMKHYTPTWLVQMPALLNPAELEEVQRRVQGATQERMLREMSEGIEVLTEQIPFVLVLEDLHWSDVSTLDLLSSLAQRTEPARLLIIGTYRPEEGLAEGHPLRALTQELQGHQQCEELALPLLSEAAVREYIHQRFPLAMLPTRLPETLHRNTEGSPLFVTAVVDDLLERGVITQVEGRWVLQGPVDAIVAEVPVSIRQLLTRQIDRLNSKEQQIMQAASVAGQEFSSATVAAAIGIGTADVEECCGVLARRQHFLRPLGYSEWPDGTQAARYSFRHALYQYLWNERVSIGQRQHLHMRIGERLESAYGEQAGDIAAELVVHFEEGRDYERAVRYLQQAAHNAFRRSAHVEAIRHVRKGLELLKTLPETPKRVQQELGLQLALGVPLLMIRGHTVPEVEATYARARELCLKMGHGETSQLFQSLLGVRRFYLVKGEFHVAHEMGERLLHLAQEAGDAVFLLWSHCALGETSFYRGELVSASEHLEQGAVLYDPRQSRSFALRYGQDPGIGCMYYLGLVRWLLGYPDQAIEMAHKAVSLAQELPGSFILAATLNFVATAHQFRREEQAVQQYAEAAVALSREQGFPLWVAAGMMLRGWALAEQKQYEEGIAQMRQGLDIWRTIGAGLAQPYYLALLADAYGKAGQEQEGLKVTIESLTRLAEDDQRVYEAELYRLKGELLLQQESQKSKACPEPGRRVKAQKSKLPNPQSQIPDPASEAEACFLKSIEIARQQRAKSLELRAAVSLARLWQKQNKKTHARNVLGEIYGWFTEGFATTDLAAARVLLDELN